MIAKFFKCAREFCFIRLRDVKRMLAAECLSIVFGQIEHVRIHELTLFSHLMTEA